VETDTTFLASLAMVSLATTSSLATDSFSLAASLSLVLVDVDESLLSGFKADGVEPGEDIELDGLVVGVATVAAAVDTGVMDEDGAAGLVDGFTVPLTTSDILFSQIPVASVLPPVVLAAGAPGVAPGRGGKDVDSNSNFGDSADLGSLEVAPVCRKFLAPSASGIPLLRLR